MPEVFRREGFVFFFYANEGQEPIHVHARKSGGFAKFWVEPIELVYSQGMKTQDLARAEALLKENTKLVLEKWHEVFGN